jgi:hypothetical protein
MKEEQPDYRITIQGKKRQTGKTLLVSIINRALQDAGFTDVEVIHDGTPEAFQRMTAPQLENVRNNVPKFFDKKIQLVEERRLLREEKVSPPTAAQMLLGD